jgi:hypothetical protein
MRRLILAAVLLVPVVARAQSALPQFCMSQPTAQAIGAALTQAQAALALMQESAQEPQRQAAAVAAAKAEQKKEDAAQKPAEPMKP